MKKRVLLLDTGKEWGGGTNSMIELLKRIDRDRFVVTPLFYDNYARGAESDLRRALADIGLDLQLLPRQRQPLGRGPGTGGAQRESLLQRVQPVAKAKAGAANPPAGPGALGMA